MQQITIQPATREEYRLIFALARNAAGGSREVIEAINKVAIYQEALWHLSDKQREKSEAGTE